MTKGKILNSKVSIIKITENIENLIECNLHSKILRYIRCVQNLCILCVKQNNFEQKKVNLYKKRELKKK